jgi:hypothetical protein
MAAKSQAAPLTQATLQTALRAAGANEAELASTQVFMDGVHDLVFYQFELRKSGQKVEALRVHQTQNNFRRSDRRASLSGCASD